MLTDEQKAFYAENGYVVVRGLLTAQEAESYRKETQDLMARVSQFRSNDATWAAAREMTGAKKTVLQHCHDVQFYSAAFSRLLVSEKLTAVAADIIPSGNVQLHHTKSFVKPPEKGSPFPLHQDAPYFPHDNHSMIAAILHFDDAPLEKGCVRVIPGSHKNGMMPHRRTGGSWHLDPQEYPLDAAVPLLAKAGDVVFFSYLTIHGSGINESSEPRTTLLIQMRDPADPPTIRTHESRGQGMMLRGVDPTCATTKPTSDREADNPAIATQIDGAGADTGAGGMMGGGMSPMGGKM